LSLDTSAVSASAFRWQQTIAIVVQSADCFTDAIDCFYSTRCVWVGLQETSSKFQVLSKLVLLDLSTS